MIPKSRIIFVLMIVFLLFCCAGSAAAADEPAFEIKRIGNINPYADNVFAIRSREGGNLKITVHDSVCVYRVIEQQINSGETRIHWDGCGYNQEKLYEKTYTITAELVEDDGSCHTVSFNTPIEYPLQCLQYAMPSSECLHLDAAEEWFLEYRTIADGKVRIELCTEGQEEPAYTYTVAAAGAKIARKSMTDIAGKKIPETGNYSVSVYEVSRPEKKHTFSLSVLEASPEKTAVAVTGKIMPDRNMSEEEIWNYMMRPSVVVDIDFFSHQKVYREPDEESGSLGTLHGQTQCLEVIRIEESWAYIGAWNHEEADYVEGWVPLSKLKTVYPKQEYGLLIDKQKQTLSVFREGKIIDTLLVSTGRAEKMKLKQETAAGCFLTGYHRVNFSMNGRKYDYVIQYDGGNLLHQTPYDWGQDKKDFTLGRGYLGAKASHACIRIQPEPGEGGINAYWLFTHIPYRTRVIILDDPDEREAAVSKLQRGDRTEPDPASFRAASDDGAGMPDSVSITFGGCLLPGGSKAFNNRTDSLVSRMKSDGENPLDNLRELFCQDDLTCVNLCIPIPEEENFSPESKGALYAPKGMEEIFRSASVELVQMTDDRISAAGGTTAQNTAEAISPYAFALRNETTVTTELKGHLFGFAGCSEKEYLRDPTVIDRRVRELKDRKCERIIFLMSWGEDRSSLHSIVQEAMAHRSIRAGADLVVGCHRGVIQGIDRMEGIPVIYSLGDLLDGSTTVKPKNQQGILVRAVFGFGDERVVPALTVIPILPYGNTNKEKNDFRPSPVLSGKEQETVLRSIWQDTADPILEQTVFMLND